MNHLSARDFKIALAIWLLSTGTSLSQDGDGLPGKIVATLQESVVFIKVATPDGKPSAVGTGFFFNVKGERGLILTNEHVIRPPRGQTTANYKLVLSSGRDGERILPAKLLAADPLRDLAVLEVISTKLPTALRLAPSDEPGNELFAAGFPYGTSLAVSTHPELTISQASVTGVAKGARPGVRWMQIDGFLNPGNSGGPVLTKDGRVRGVAVATILGQKVSFFISNHDVATFFAGALREIEIREKPAAAGELAYAVTVRTIDPVARISAVEVIAKSEGAASKTQPIQLQRQGSDWVGELRLRGKAGSLARYRIQASAKGRNSKELNTVSKSFMAAFDGGAQPAVTSVPDWILKRGEVTAAQSDSSAPKILVAEGGLPTGKVVMQAPARLTMVADFKQFGFDGPTYAHDSRKGVFYFAENGRLAPGLIKAIDYRQQRELRRAYLPMACRLLGINKAGLVLVPGTGDRGNSERPSEVWILDPETFKVRRILQITTTPPSFTPEDSTLLYTLESRDKIDVWDLESGKHRASLTPTKLHELLPQDFPERTRTLRGHVNKYAVSPDGTDIIIGSHGFHHFKADGTGLTYVSSSQKMNSAPDQFSVSANYVSFRNRLFALDDLTKPLISGFKGEATPMVPHKSTRSIYGLSSTENGGISVKRMAPDGSIVSEADLPILSGPGSELIGTRTSALLLRTSVHFNRGKIPGHGTWRFFLVEFPTE